MAILTHAQLEQLWITAGGSAATADTAAAIAQAESGGNTNAILNTAYPNLPGYHPPGAGASPEYSVGLWQINLVAHPQYTAAEMLGAVANADAAARISSFGRNFDAWTTFTHGTYQQYLQTGGEPVPQPGTTSGAIGSVRAARAFSGWQDLRNSVNHHLPKQLTRSQRTGEVTLRLLMHRHKVGR